MALGDNHKNDKQNPDAAASFKLADTGTETKDTKQEAKKLSTKSSDKISLSKEGNEQPDPSSLSKKSSSTKITWF